VINQGEENMKYEDIKEFYQRCDEHPDHQSGMISNSMIQQRLHEEIDELREYIEQALKEKNT
jgi:DNA-binding transcriptional MerR regulator